MKTINIKYHNSDLKKIEKIEIGDWIDLRAAEDVELKAGDFKIISLGVSMKLPEGYEAHIVPRSSTFKTWGVIQTNSVGVVDDTYIGDNDQWHMPVYCLQGKTFADKINGEYNQMESYTKVIGDRVKGTWIHKGDKIGQFRIMEIMPEIEFEEVEAFNNKDRGGFGSTGTR